MVTINYEQFDSLIYIDDHTTEEERSNVQRLVREELANSGNGAFNPQVGFQHTNTQAQPQHQHAQTQQLPLHPMVDQMLPLPSRNENHSPMLMNEIERYEEEQEEAGGDIDLLDEPPAVLRGGIDMSRYSEFTTASTSTSNDRNDQNAHIDGDEQIHYDILYTTLSYSMLQSRSLNIALDNANNINALERAQLRTVRSMEADMASQVRSKRERMDEINRERKRRQVVDFKPVNDYLQDRWKDGIKTVVDLGIESGKMDHS